MIDRDEEVLLNGLGRRTDIVLTSHRLIQRQGGGVFRRPHRLEEFPLDEIMDMSIGFIRRMSLLAIGTILVLSGVVTRSFLPSEVGDAAWMIGIVTTIYFVVSGRRGIVVKTRYRGMKIHTGGVKADDVREFVFTLEDARNRLMGIVDGDPEDAGARAGGERRVDLRDSDSE